MRRLRTVVGAIFILSLAAYIGFHIYWNIIKDTTPPSITAESDTVSVSVEAEDDSQLYEGLSAKDSRDGDLTDDIRISSMSNFTEPGKREVTYAVFDKANNSATLTRTLEYTDYTSPQIRLSKPLRYSLNEMSDVNLTDNMSVDDCLDGNITSQIRATYNDSVYIQQAGDYPVTVQVSNSAGDTCSAGLTVTVTDPSDPQESEKYYPMLSDYIVYVPVGGSVDYASLITGFERNGTEYPFDGGNGSLEPARRDEVAISGNVDFNTEGSYTVDYQYTSRDGVTATTKLAVVVG